MRKTDECSVYPRCRENHSREDEEMLNVLKQTAVGIMLVVLVALAAYSAYAQYWSWGALKRQEQRLDAIEKQVGANPQEAQTAQAAQAADAQRPQRAPAAVKRSSY
jgi:hypothetical protein